MTLSLTGAARRPQEGAQRDGYSTGAPRPRQPPPKVAGARAIIHAILDASGKSTAIEPGTPEAEAFERELMLLGRNRAPDRFLDAVLTDEISTALMRELILDVWCGAEVPARAIGGGDPEAGPLLWAQMFRRTGFVADSDELPEMSATFFRGAPLDNPKGFSWSWDRGVAVRFAERYQLALQRPCGIFSVTLDRNHLLGLITDGRKECEVIVNPEILTGDLEPRLEQVLGPVESAARVPLNTY